METMFVTREQGLDQEGRPLSFNYYVLIDEAAIGDRFFCESYGVRIADGGNSGEECSIPNITTSTRRIDELMEYLTRNFVTPTTLPDVVADWL